MKTGLLLGGGGLGKGTRSALEKERANRWEKEKLIHGQGGILGVWGPIKPQEKLEFGGMGPKWLVKQALTHWRENLGERVGLCKRDIWQIQGAKR